MHDVFSHDDEALIGQIPDESQGNLTRTVHDPSDVLHRHGPCTE